MITQWNCEGCGKRGAVYHPEDADVMTVVALIEVDHKMNSPGCTVAVRGLRVSLIPAAARQEGT